MKRKHAHQTDDELADDADNLRTEDRHQDDLKRQRRQRRQFKQQALTAALSA